eukprot:1155125-Pelagomonas_calceolata.AAC.4
MAHIYRLWALDKCQMQRRCTELTSPRHCACSGPHIVKYSEAEEYQSNEHLTNCSTTEGHMAACPIQTQF